MFNVILYNFEKKNNSTKRPASDDGQLFICRLKESTSAMNPVMRFDVGLVTSPTDYNYAYIPNFDRYYFINDWTFNGPTWDASMTVDVLASFKTAIGEQEMYVLRSADDSNGNILDDFYPTKTSLLNGSPARSLAPDEVTISSHRGTVTDSNYWQKTDLTGFYVIGVTGDNNVKYYGMTGNVFYYLMKDLLSFSPEDMEDVSSGIAKSIAKPVQYISSCYWIPITSVPRFSDYAESQSIKFGWYSMGPYYCMQLDPMFDSFSVEFKIDIPKHPYASSRGSYLNMQPYTIYTLDYLPFGAFSLNNIDISQDTKIGCSVEVDIATGKGELYVSTVSGKIFLLHSSALYGVPVPIAQATNDLISSISSVLTGSVGAATGLVTGNIPGAITSYASGIISGIKSALPEINSVGSQGSVIGFRKHIPQVWTKCYDIVDEDIEHKGRPLCEEKELDTLTGYIECRDGDIDIACTEEERNQISSFLTGGFFYE